MEKFVTTFICSVCDTEYITNPGYCDETLECAFDEGENIIAV